MAYMGFNALKGKLAGQPGVTNPGALAASIGRKKYGKKKFQKAAAQGKSLEGTPAKEETMEQYAARRKKEKSSKKK